MFCTLCRRCMAGNAIEIGRHFYFLCQNERRKEKQTLSHHLYISIFGMASLMCLTPFHSIEILEILKKSLLSDQALLRTQNYLTLKQITICCPKFMRRSVGWLYVYVHSVVVLVVRCLSVWFSSLSIVSAPHWLHSLGRAKSIHLCLSLTIKQRCAALYRHSILIYRACRHGLR